MSDKRIPLQSKMTSRISQNMSTLAYTQMTDEELTDHSAQLAYARAKRSGDRYSRAEIELWNVVQAIFPGRRNQPLDNFVRGIDGSGGFGMQRFLLCAQLLEAGLLKACAFGPSKPDRAARSGMRRFMLDCLADWVKGAGMPLSPTSLLQNMDKLEYAIDYEYPGYMEAGMLHLAITALPHSP